MTYNYETQSLIIKWEKTVKPGTYIIKLKILESQKRRILTKERNEFLKIEIYF
jgi:hypothetical protein